MAKLNRVIGFNTTTGNVSMIGCSENITKPVAVEAIGRGLKVRNMLDTLLSAEDAVVLAQFWDESYVVVNRFSEVMILDFSRGILSPSFMSHVGEASESIYNETPWTTEVRECTVVRSYDDAPDEDSSGLHVVIKNSRGQVILNRLMEVVR